MKKEKFSPLPYVVVVLMGLLLAVNYTLFVVPNSFAPAGINGVAVMVQYKLGFSVGYMALLVNIPLCIFAFFAIRREFAVRTLLFCVAYSGFYLYLQNSGMLARFAYNAEGVDTIYPVILAGLISGFVYGMVIPRDACTGGTDILARYVSKKKPALNFFWISFSLNAVVALSSYFVFVQNVDGEPVYNMKPVCLCLLYCFTSSFIGTTILSQSRAASEFVVITKHPDEIEKIIIEQMHHSATRIEATGVYTGKEKTVLLCVVNRHQGVEFLHAVQHFPDTFVIEQTVSNTVGNFKRIKKKF